MIQLMLIFLFFVLAFVLYGSTNTVGQHSSTKRVNKQYLSEFKVYLCLKKRLILYPPKEICIENKYYILNLSTKSNLLAHKNIIAKNQQLTKCTECLHRCIPGIEGSDMIDLNLSFATFKHLSNHELNTHLKAILTDEQYEYLFNEETKSEASN